MRDTESNAEVVPQWAKAFVAQLKGTMTRHLDNMEAKFEKEITTIFHLQSCQSTLTKIVLDKVIKNDHASIPGKSTVNNQLMDIMSQRLDKMEAKLEEEMSIILQLQSCQSTITQIILDKMIEKGVAPDSIVAECDLPVQIMKNYPDHVEVSSGKEPLIIEDKPGILVSFKNEDDSETREVPIPVCSKKLTADNDNGYFGMFPKIMIRGSRIFISLKERSLYDSSCEEYESSDDEDSATLTGDEYEDGDSQTLTGDEYEDGDSETLTGDEYEDGSSYYNDSDYDDFGYHETVLRKDQTTVKKIQYLLKNISLQNWWTTKKKLLKFSISTPQASMKLVDIFYDKLRESEGRLHMHLAKIIDEFTKNHDGIRGQNETIFWNLIEDIQWPLSMDELKDLTNFVIKHLPNEFKYHAMMMLIIHDFRSLPKFLNLVILMKQISGTRSVRYLRRNLHLGYYMKN